MEQIGTGTIEKSDSNVYTFRKKLGEGSYGSVWLADKQDGEQVAIKIYKTILGIVDEFTDELDNLKEIRRDDVCKKYSTCLIDDYFVGDSPRIVLTYIKGETLAHYRYRIPRSKRYENFQLQNILINGMDAFHRLGITHLDIKEANIMIDDEGYPRYVDWGLACLHKYCQPGCDKHCASSGTAYTMPPGINFNNKNKATFSQTVAHDIWSLGVTLLDWYTLTEPVVSYYYGGKGQGGLRTDRALLYLSPEKIKARIDTITDPKIVKLLMLMLNRSEEERVANWPEIVKLSDDIVKKALMITIPSGTKLVKNILFMPCASLDLPEFKPILDRLIRLHGTCNNYFSCCAIYGATCTSHIVIYINSKPLETEYYDLEYVLPELLNHPEEIKASLLVVHVSKMLEIYDVCTSPESRGIGVMTKLLAAVLKEVREESIDGVWIGVDPRNKNWDSVIKLYAKAGFTNPSLTRNSGASLKPLSLTAIGLTKNKYSENADINAVIEKANRIRKQYFDAVVNNYNVVRLYFGAELCEYMYAYLQEDREYAGTITTNGFIIGPDNFGYANMTYSLDTESLGMNPPEFYVDIPQTALSFHTHPNICYEYNRCYIGWPSGPDVYYVVINYPNTIKHYVITYEGIYSMQLTIDAQLYLEAHPESQSILADALKTIFISAEMERSDKSNKKQHTVAEFFKHVNSLTIRDLDKSSDANVIILSVGLFTWDSIRNDKGFVDCMYSVRPTPSVYNPDSQAIGYNPNVLQYQPSDPPGGIPYVTC